MVLLARVGLAALGLALFGALWFFWPFLRIRAQEAWHRWRKTPGPTRPRGPAVNPRRRRKRSLMRMYGLSGRQFTRLRKASQREQMIAIARNAETGKGRVIVAGEPRRARATVMGDSPVDRVVEREPAA